MAALVKGRRLIGLVTPRAKVKGRQLKAIVASTVGVKGRGLSGKAAKATKVKGRTLSAQVAIAAGAPIAAAGPAQRVSAGGRVQLTVSYVLSAGVVLQSITWRLVTRPSGAPLPVLSATNVQSPTLYAPLDQTERTYVFGVTVKDSANRTSAEGLVSITVEEPDYLLATRAGWSVGVQDSYAVGTVWT